MALPVYTELSNFTTRVSGGRKVPMDLSVVLVISSLSDPVDAINSLYNLITKMKQKTELILINTDKDGYKYDKLLATFPSLRVLLPQERIGLREALALGVSESLSRNILFTDEHCLIRSLNLEVLDMYLSESGFGILLPLLTDDRDEVIPNIVKGNARHGFLNTISTDIVGTAVTSLYPKYFCFILNQEAYASRNMTLNSYENPQYTLLELGFRIWKEGYLITQARNFKVRYAGRAAEDIAEDSPGADYIRFNFLNLCGRETARGRMLKAASLALKALSRLDFKAVAALFSLLAASRRDRQKIMAKPVEDLTIFSIINKDIK